jgi:hypothetical protein
MQVASLIFVNSVDPRSKNCAPKRARRVGTGERADAFLRERMGRLAGGQVFSSKVPSPIVKQSAG